MLRERVLEWTHEWEQQGWVKGIEQGLEPGLETEKALLIRLIERRFGQAVVEPVQVRIKLIQDSDSLERIGDWIVDCKDGEEFLSEFFRHYPA